MGKVRKGIVLVVKNNQDQFLLLRQKKDQSWCFISGGKEEGEELVDTAIREANEEAGLSLSKEMIKETAEVIRFTNSKGRGEQRVYLVVLDNSEVKVDYSEIDSYKWVSAEDAQELLQPKEVLLNLIQKYKVSI